MKLTLIPKKVYTTDYIHTQIPTEQVQLLHDLLPLGRGLSRLPHPHRVHDEQSHCPLRLVGGRPPPHTRRHQDVPAREVHAARQVGTGRPGPTATRALFTFSHVGALASENRFSRCWRIGVRMLGGKMISACVALYQNVQPVQPIILTSIIFTGSRRSRLHPESLPHRCPLGQHRDGRGPLRHRPLLLRDMSLVFEVQSLEPTSLSPQSCIFFHFSVTACFSCSYVPLDHINCIVNAGPRSK